MMATTGIVLCLVLLVNIPQISAPWTGWYDRDDPSGSGDYELRTLMDPVPCGGAIPNFIEAREVWGSSYRWMLRTHNYIHIGPRYGLVCENNKNLWSPLPAPQCRDYSVNYVFPYSPTFDVDNPGGSGDWELAVQAPWNTSATRFYFQTIPASNIYGSRIGRIIRVGAKYGLICRNTENIDKGLGSCGDYQVRFYCPSTLSRLCRKECQLHMYRSMPAIFDNLQLE